MDSGLRLEFYQLWDTCHATTRWSNQQIICMPIFNWPVQVESSSKINHVSGFPFYPVSLIFVLYFALVYRGTRLCLLVYSFLLQLLCPCPWLSVDRAAAISVMGRAVWVISTPSLTPTRPEGAAPIISPCLWCCSGAEKVLLTILLREVSQCPEMVSQLHLY